MLQLHSKDAGDGEECELRPPFTWTRDRAGGKEPLLIDDPNILNAIVDGGLGVWRIKQISFARRMSLIALFLAILFPLCFGFQFILALLGFVVPVYRFYSSAQNGTIYYYPLNYAAPYGLGLYLDDGTLIQSFRTGVTTDTSTYALAILVISFIVLGALGYIIGCREACAAHRIYPSSVFRPRALRMMSCWMMALYSAFFGGFLSIAAGYLHKSDWQTGLEYTIALLVSGLLLGVLFIWRGYRGNTEDMKSWLIPPFPRPTKHVINPPA